MLLKYNANPNQKDSVRIIIYINLKQIGNTPMHFAAMSGNLSIVRMLDEYNADATIKNDNDVCSIDIAIS